MALTLAVGFVVDDAIVMLENIVRHMEMGRAGHAGGIDGSREISFTILSMTLSLVAVFIPVLFLGGIIGRLFHEFAVTIGVAILVSGFVSLTLTPMLCSRWLKPHAATSSMAGCTRVIERACEKSLGRYERSLAGSWTIGRWPWPSALLILVGTVCWAGSCPRASFPSEDTSQLFATTEAAEGTSSTPWSGTSRQRPRSSQEDPNIDGLHVLGRRRRRPARSTRAG